MIRDGARIGFVVSGLLHIAAIAAIAAVVMPTDPARSPVADSQHLELSLAMFELPTPPAPPAPVEPLAAEPPALPNPVSEPAPRPKPASATAPMQPAPPAPDIKPDKPSITPRPSPPERPKPVRAAISPSKPPERKPAAHKSSQTKRTEPRRQAAPTASSTPQSHSRELLASESAGRPINPQRIADRYLASLVSAIQRHRFYPAASRRLKEDGTVVVRFILLSSGAFSSIAVSQSSGFPRLDSAALEAVRQTGPFKPIPAEIGKTQWPLTVPIVYRLRRE